VIKKEHYTIEKKKVCGDQSLSAEQEETQRRKVTGANRPRGQIRGPKLGKK